MSVKRALVWGISQILGAVVTYLIITVGFDLLPLFSSVQTPQGVTVEEYGYMYFLVTSVPIGLIFMIWMDRFMDTGILPD